MGRGLYGLLRMRTCCLLIAQLFLPCCSALARQPAISALKIGFDGAYKVGFWTPVTVRVEGIDQETAACVEITVPDGDGLPVLYVLEDGVPPVRFDKSTEYVLFAKFGRVHGSISARVMIDQETVASRTFSPGEFPSALPANQQLVVHFGSNAGVEGGIQKLQRDNIHVARLESGEWLPDRWWGYEGIDTLVLTTGTGNLGERMSAQQAAAMGHWMRMGGQIILSVGRHGDQLFGAADSLLADFVPGDFRGVVDQCQTVGLENFADFTQPIEVRRSAAGRCELDLAWIDKPSGKVEVMERRAGGAYPVVIRSCTGFGQLVLVTVDLDLPPISDWTGRDRLVGRLLEWTLGKSTDQQRSGVVGAMRHPGYTDLAGQLRSAMDHYTAVTFVPFELVATLIVAYVLLIGPLDYFLVKHGFRRMEWTWLTFPLMVIGCCVLTYGLAHHLKGNTLWINQVDVVDVDGRTGFLRGTTWSHAISPATQRYDLALETAIPSEVAAKGSGEVLLSWQGLPGDALGGMNSKSTAEQLSESYAIQGPASNTSNRSDIVGLPMQIWSTKALQSRWWLNVDLGSLGQLRATPDGQLRGQVHIPLQVDLADCYLYYAPWAYQLGKIPAGRTTSVGTATVRRNLHWRLTRRTLSEVSDNITPWDQYSRDVPRIVEMMMFHAAAGGEKYTGLLNRYQTFVDMSQHLSIGEAVLVGRTSHPATRLWRGDESLENCYDQRWAFYRFVIPVEPATPARVSDDTRRSDSLSRN